MQRRDFLRTAAIGAGTLAAPSLARAQGQSVLKFIPQSDPTILDPVWTTAYVTRNHAAMIFDTLFATDGAFKTQPQMAEGMVVEDDGKRLRITLRPGLMFHDNTPVLARDCAASIARWGKRDSFGQTLMAVTDELSAPDDRTIQFRLKKPFALLPDALGKSGSNWPAMMPERLAKTDAFTQVTEMVGSGPFRWNAAERVVGSRAVYEKFAGYKPRESGAAEWTSGPKLVHYDRVEWQIVPDSSTAGAALQRGEVDWWENPPQDLVPLLKRQRDLVVAVQDPTGQVACMRLNQLVAPFDNPAIRRALLKGISQTDFMQAVVGDDASMYHVPTGLFCPGTPMATDVGLDVFTGTRDYAAVKRDIAAAGYKGERVVLMAPTDFPILKALADVGADALQKCGLNVDYQAMDWGSAVQRRAKKDPIDKGGWSVFHTFWAGLDQFSPAVNAFMRAQGPETGMMGWPTSPRIEALRNQWLDATDVASQKSIAADIQRQALIDVPYIPLGQNFYSTAYNKRITGVLNGFVMFWNVRPA